MPFLAGPGKSKACTTNTVDTVDTVLHIQAIPCQRFEKKGQRRKVDFFYEIEKIIRQFDDFGRF